MNADYPAQMRVIMEKFCLDLERATRAFKAGQFETCRAELRGALATTGEAQNLREAGPRK